MPSDGAQYRHEWTPPLPKTAINVPVVFPAKVPKLYEHAKQYLQRRELDHGLAFRIGWYPGMHHGPRLIIPCDRNDGLFWQGRLLENAVADPGEWDRWDSPLGSKGDAIVFIKGDPETLVVGEGPMDALAAAGLGFSAAATLGVRPTVPVINHLAGVAREYRDVILLADRDSLVDWMKWQRFLGSMGVHGDLWEPWSGYKDLAAMSIEKRKEFFAFHGYKFE
jgi:hypothetical protein